GHRGTAAVERVCGGMPHWPATGAGGRYVRVASGFSPPARVVERPCPNSAGGWTVRTAWSILFALVIALVLSPAGGAPPANRGAPAPMGNVRHEPAAPKPGVTVLVTVRLPEGVTRPVLRLQAVAPGKYVRKSDPAYEKDWTDL